MGSWTGTQSAFAVKVLQKRCQFGDRSAWISKSSGFIAIVNIAIFSGVRTVLTLPPFVFSVEPVTSKFRTQVLMAWADGTARLGWLPLFEIYAERSPNCDRFCKTFSQQKHVVLQSTAPLQVKLFKGGTKMAVAVSALVCQPGKNNVSKSPGSLTHPIQSAHKSH
jgi:hypothetical protein